MPKLSHRSKAIHKGTAYQDKIARRKDNALAIAPSRGGNRLSQKHAKETFKNVPGICLTNAAARKKLKKAKAKAAKLAANQSWVDVSDSESMHSSNDGEPEETKDDEGMK